jgi:acetoin utilization deacetylase AcuC-like enzyme
MHLSRREFIEKTVSAALVMQGLNTKSLADNTSLAKNLPTGIVYDAVYKRHITGIGHPENPNRCDAITNALSDAGFDNQICYLKPKLAEDEEILACHTPEYIATVKRDVAAGRQMLSTGDSPICKDSLNVALYAAGGVLSAIDAIFEGRIRNAFCVVRPPGHHATRQRGMGFCIFNNVAVAARFAQRKYKLSKVLIVDWDVHHGNGTQDIFYEDPTVFYFSTHQSPWYPGTGAKEETGKGKGEGYTLNCPFPAGAGRKEIVGAFREKLVSAAEWFKPDLVLISAGFDSRIGDPLGRFRLTDEDFLELTNIMQDVAHKSAKGRLISVLEGGYNLEGLGQAAVAHVRGMVRGSSLVARDSSSHETRVQSPGLDGD